MSSDWQFITATTFVKSVNRLASKYPSLRSYLGALKEILLANPLEGSALGRNCYKVRMKISSKNTGKSGGARVITLVKIEQTRITL